MKNNEYQHLFSRSKDHYLLVNKPYRPKKTTVNETVTVEIISKYIVFDTCEL